MSHSGTVLNAPKRRIFWPKHCFAIISEKEAVYRSVFCFQDRKIDWRLNKKFNIFPLLVFIESFFFRVSLKKIWNNHKFSFSFIEKHIFYTSFGFLLPKFCQEHAGREFKWGRSGILWMANLYHWKLCGKN